MKKAVTIGAVLCLAVVAGWYILPAAAEAGLGGGRCGTARQRVQVQWQNLKLTAQTSGNAYAATARPVEEVVKDLFSELKPDNKPTVVWLIDITDESNNQKAEGTIFQNENVGLALKRFNCFKVNVRNLPDGELKEKYLKKVGFHFFDPAAEPALRPLTGKRATSLSTFSGYVEKIWDRTYTMRLKAYWKAMKDVLDGFDRVESKKQVVEAKVEKLKEKPNPRLQRSVDKELEELAAQMAEVEEIEKQIFAECTLRPAYLPEVAGDETGKK